jgi:molecular chaperone GrpE
MTDKTNTAPADDAPVEEKTETKTSKSKTVKPKKSRRLSKTKKLEDRIQELEESLQTSGEAQQELQQQLLRTLADQENLRKRMQREQESTGRRAQAEVFRQLLPIIDDISRSVDPEHQTDDVALLEGIRMIHQKLEKFLEQQGVSRFQSQGEEFDIDLHEAIAQMKRDDTPSGHVAEVYEEGFRLHDMILRHAKVVVSE